MQQPIFLTDASVFRDARDLLTLFGDSAGIEASIRAGRSRDLGNVIHFCRWRQVGQLVDLMSGGEAPATRH